MPENLQYTISQNALKHYILFRNVGNGDLRWFQIVTDIGKKLNV